MKRTGELKRKTRIKSNRAARAFGAFDLVDDNEPTEQPWKRTGGRPTKTRRTASDFDKELLAVKPAIRWRSGGQCEFLHVPTGANQFRRCTWVAQAIHHRKRRSQGGSNGEINLLHLCERHHEQIHRYPKRSYVWGYLIRSTSPETELDRP